MTGKNDVFTCRWLGEFTGTPCDASFSTKRALLSHIYSRHLKPM